jgi:hypothetical protein
MLNNERGLATIEVVPLIVVFLVLISYGMGAWGIVHAATLHSIGARTYAFETFRSRTNLEYYREDGSAITGDVHGLKKLGFRYHSIRNPTGADLDFTAPVRRVAFITPNPEVDGGNNPTTHNQKIFDLTAAGRNTDTRVTPAWIMVAYGICLNSTCGEQ